MENLLGQLLWYVIRKQDGKGQLKPGIKLQGRSGTVVRFCQMCLFYMQRWGELGKVTIAPYYCYLIYIFGLFRALGCYYVMFGEADVTAAKLPFLLLRLSGVRCCEEPPASITFGGSSSMPLAHSEELRNTSSAALTVCCWNSHSSSLSGKKQCMFIGPQWRLWKNIGLFGHTEFLLQITQIHDNALKEDPREKSVSPSFSLWKDLPILYTRQLLTLR